MGHLLDGCGVHAGRQRRNVARLACIVEDVPHRFELSSAVNQWVAGENLLNQGSTRARHSDNEYTPCGRIAVLLQPLDRSPSYGVAVITEEFDFPRLFVCDLL